MTTARDALVAVLEQHNDAQYDRPKRQWQCRCGASVSNNTPRIDHRAHLVAELLAAVGDENERLQKLNDGLARQVLAMGATLEAGRRELLATGWDACTDRMSKELTDAAPDYAEQVKDENPYRKPALDFSGAIICKTRDDA